MYHCTLYHICFTMCIDMGANNYVLRVAAAALYTLFLVKESAMYSCILLCCYIIYSALKRVYSSLPLFKVLFHYHKQYDFDSHISF